MKATKTLLLHFPVIILIGSGRDILPFVYYRTDTPFETIGSEGTEFIIQLPVTS